MVMMSCKPMTSLVGGEEPFRNLDTFTPPFSSPLLAAFVAVVEKSRSVPPSLGHNGPWFRTFGAVLSRAVLGKKNFPQRLISRSVRPLVSFWKKAVVGVYHYGSVIYEFVTMGKVSCLISASIKP